MADSVATPFWNKSTNILLVIGCVGIAAIATAIGFLTNKKDKGEEIKLQLGLILVATVVLCAIFAFAAYTYFSSYPAYLTNFILVITFINLALSVFAVGAATINVSTV